MGRKLGLCPFVVELGTHLTQCGLGQAYLHAKLHFDPSIRLATMHQRYTYRRTDRTTAREHRANSFTKGRSKMKTKWRMCIF